MDYRYYIKFSNGSISDWFYYIKDARTELLLLNYLVTDKTATNIYDPSDAAVIIKVFDHELTG